MAVAVVLLFRDEKFRERKRKKEEIPPKRIHNGTSEKTERPKDRVASLEIACIHELRFK